MTYISPSILAADFLNLEKDIKKAENSKATWLHLDVMDGVFVPNITFGYDLVSKIDKITDMFLDTHLMIVDPASYVQHFVDAGSDMITFHIESYNEQQKTMDCIDKIISNGIKVGLALKPNTPIEQLEPFIEKLDMVLIMSVEPGFGGQKFNDVCIEKIKTIRKSNPNIIIQVDGGIDDQTSKLVKDAGANCLVAGSYLFNNNLEENVEKLLQ